MNNHLEFDLLSAYTDGDVDDAQRSLIDSHLATCAHCGQTLRALQATLTDLTTLEVAEPSEQDRWALRSALAGARAAEKSRRYPRYVMAAAGVAASIIAIVAFVSRGNGPDHGAIFNAAPATSALELAPTDYDESSARALISAVDQSKWAYRADQAPILATGSTDAAAKDGAAPAQTGDASRCQAAIAPKDGAMRGSFPARFKGQDAFFFIFGVPAQDSTRLELWVTTTDSCDTLFFAQHALSK